MPAGSYIGGTSFRTVSISEIEDSEGVDRLTVVRRGKTSELAAEVAAWTKGRVATSLGYSNMYLQTKRSQEGGGSNFAELVLDFAGYLSTTISNPVSVDDSIALGSGTFVSDENDSDGNAQNVQAQFNGQSTTTRWIFYGLNPPTSPRYPLKVASTVPTNILFGHYPASYTGTLQTKLESRLMGFERSELARGVWAVTETWAERVVPDDTA
jgi:hypothetical protein